MKRYMIGFSAGFVLGALSLALAMRYSHSAPPKWLFPYEDRKVARGDSSDGGWYSELDARYKAYIQSAPNFPAMQSRAIDVYFCQSLEWSFDKCATWHPEMRHAGKGQTAVRRTRSGQH